MKNYKQITIYVTLLGVTVMLMLLLWSYGKSSPSVKRITEDVRDFGEICNEGILRVATEYNQIGYFIDGDTVSGFQYDLVLLFGKAMNLQVEIYPEMDMQKSIDGLQSRKYDIIARNLSITGSLRKGMSFTHPLILNKQVLVQRKAEFNQGLHPVRNQLDLARKTLYIPKNSPSMMRIRNLSVEIGDTVYVDEVEKYGDEQLIIMVAKGDIDYAVCDEIIAQKSQAVYPEIDIDTDISFTQLNAWAVRKDSPELLDSLNTWISRLKKSKEIDKIQRKYFSF
ncbi:MAG: transporter substrate-binding domain-containing protein [Bacteroidales bacterium]|jgi:membrane-bound lytic murein transglycosylase MltF|nr:transporter substrate-binding domain-containing protein [Bacteroidales bacterium]